MKEKTDSVRNTARRERKTYLQKARRKVLREQ